MKKLIAILTIAIVLVGAVFAADLGQADIVVTTTIAPAVPNFKLVSGSAEDTLGDNTTVATTKVELATDLTADNATAETVTFTIKQVGRARTTKAFTFTATATDLLLVKYTNAAGNEVANSGNTASTADAADQKFEVNGGNNGTWSVNTFANSTVLTSSQATMAGASTTSYSVTYKGRPVADDTAVGSFTVTWNPNANAVEGTYEATVTLTCTST